MVRILTWLADHPAHSAVFVILLTVFFATQLPRLEIDASAEGMMAVHDPARQYYEDVKRRFGSDSITIVVVNGEDIFAPSVLRAIRDLSQALERVDGVTRVESLTTFHGMRMAGGVLGMDPLIPAEIPTQVSDLHRVRSNALSDRILVGHLVASTGKAAAIHVFTDPRAGDNEFNLRFSSQVEELVRLHSSPKLSIYQIGVPYAKATFAAWIRRDLLTLLPIVVAVVGLVLWLQCRNVQGVMIPMLTGGVSIVWALGLMALAQLPLNVLTATLPLLLITIGFAEDIHMLSVYHHNLRRGLERRQAIHEMAAHVALPITVTTATTVVGFSTLSTTDIGLLVQFGYAASMGLIANFIVTISLLPVLLRLIAAPRGLRPPGAAEDPRNRGAEHILAWLADRVIRWRVIIIAVTAVLIGISTIGWYRLRVDTDFLSYFPADSLIRQRHRAFHDSLGGGLVFYLVVDTGRVDGVTEPAVLQRLVGLQDFLARTGRIANSLSVADFMRRMHREMNGGDPASETIPPTRELAAQYLAILRAGQNVSRYVDLTASSATIVVSHHITSSWELAALLKQLDDHVSRLGSDLTIRPTGESILLATAADTMAVNEVTSLLYTLVVIGLIHACLFRSLAVGFLSLVPNVIPVLFNFGLMGLLGVPLNTGTAMIATIAIGIAVDDTVHVIIGFRRWLAQYGDPKVAVVATIVAQGRPITYVSLALAAGFLAMALSQFVQIGHLGIFSAYVMIVAMVAELVLTPILMYVMPGVWWNGATRRTAALPDALG